MLISSIISLFKIGNYVFILLLLSMRINYTKVFIFMAMFLVPVATSIAAPDPPPPSTPPPPPGLPLDGGLFILTLLSVLLAFYKIYNLNTKKASS